MAKQNYIATSAAEGGYLGLVTEEPFEEKARQILSLEQGDISGVFEGPDGYYIVKLNEKKGGTPRALDAELTEYIKQTLLLSKQQTALMDYVGELEKKIKPERNEDLIK